MISAKNRELAEEVPEWMDFSRTSEENRREILHSLEEELRGGAQSDLAPCLRDSVLFSEQRDAAVADRKR